METKTKSTFKGKPLIEIPAFIPQIGFLEGDFGRAFLEEHQGRAGSDYNGNSALNVLGYNGNVVTGSNPFSVVLANQILKQEGLRTASQADLETAMRIGAMNFRGTYEDTALVLRTEDDKDYSRNTPLARDLGRQLKERGVKFGAKSPLIIPLTDLDLQKAENDYGLTFKLREDAEVYEAPILTKEGKFNSEDIDERTGLPKQVKGGNRTLYSRNSGLSGLFLGLGLGLGSGNWGLDYSSVDGRVVLVSAAGARADFDQRLTGLETQRQEAHQTYLAKLSQLIESIDSELKRSK